ncbi:hypothetical protein DEO72_LG4g61 [Vigna unguiculata]|uniref:Uncharacterized protein n=1 Tax=Vigna unguiculata TaxID=3917 RepID=A0A4D6LKT3_VIGUN|nr:hypothetical protein DEO72_LG4g61 [Vigna unguiculata]
MGAGSANGVKGPKVGLIELSETTVRKDIEINVPESLMDSIDNMEPKALVKAMVEFSTGRSHFYTADGNTKCSFFWIGNPWRYKVISREDLLVVEKDVVDTLMQFSNKMPTKGLVRVHMAQLGKKNLTLFQTLRKEKAVKAKVAENTMVPNLQDSLVDVHVHGGTKRKVKFPIRSGKGKDVKKVRAAVMGAGSANGVKGPKVGLIELSETTVRKDIEINVPESLMDSIDNMEPKALR